MHSLKEGIAVVKDLIDRDGLIGTHEEDLTLRPGNDLSQNLWFSCGRSVDFLVAMATTPESLLRFLNQQQEHDRIYDPVRSSIYSLTYQADQKHDPTKVRRPYDANVSSGVR